ncbi:MAG: GGDEF domain-containing protein [Candidatus Eisenbacteria bacterium]|nr:GGDEF domain-containing protein [Candidatus Eisenbacteria bacterium]MCC7141805.1 GGDEF domain-containing protein [Candidatus Eisenbacteria bacterium]
MNNYTGLGRELLELLSGIGPHERSEWLIRLLRLAREATGASFVYLGETGREGVIRHGLIRDRLVRREEDKLLGLARVVVSRGAAVLEPELSRSGSFRAAADGWDGMEAAGYAAVPVPVPAPGRAWLGAVRDKSAPGFDPGTLARLELVATATATALTLEARCRELDDLAMTDGLTQIPNYRFLRIALDQEVARAARHEQLFSVVMVDVDNLKQYNHAHGHLVGSELLRNLAQVLKRETRGSDIVTRYGGDEFVLLLPKTDLAGAMTLCERLRQKVCDGLRGRGGEAVTASFGVAGFPADGRTFESLVSAADQALRQAKGDGRNQVVCLGA